MRIRDLLSCHTTHALQEMQTQTTRRLESEDKNLQFEDGEECPRGPRIGLVLVDSVTRLGSLDPSVPQTCEQTECGALLLFFCFSFDDINPITLDCSNRALEFVSFDFCLQENKLARRDTRGSGRSSGIIRRRENRGVSESQKDPLNTISFRSTPSIHCRQEDHTPTTGNHLPACERTRNEHACAYHEP